MDHFKVQIAAARSEGMRAAKFKRAASPPYNIKALDDAWLEGHAAKTAEQSNEA